MALALYDRVRETSTIVGTGTATLLGAVPGYQSFSVVGNANTTYYCIFNTGTTEWEVGIGTYTSSGTTLSRTTILASSNSGSAVSFTAGTKDVFVTYPAGYTAFSTNNATQASGQVLTSNGTGVGPTWQAAPAAAAGTLTGTTLASNVVTSSLTSVGTITSLAATAANITSLGVNTAASGTAGEIRATNNITAYYSDERLKTKIGNIENALDKVKKIETMVYHANDTAVELGYDSSIIEVGVTAQSVQKVQPEVVVPAPINDKYLTVRYEKLVPLLIEAIKELEAKVAQLEAR
jgi:hypothetical protein